MYMLEQFRKMSEEELDKEIRRVREHYENEELSELYRKAADYEIRTYEEMKSELRYLDRRYQDDMMERGRNVCDGEFCDFFIGCLTDAEKHSSLQLHAIEWCKIRGVLSDLHSPHFENEDGERCDEYGRPLTADGEHYIGEIIEGGKFRDRKK